MREQMKCPKCGTEMIQKSRVRLLLVGSGMIASVGIALIAPVLWGPCIVAALAGLYLVVWATAGKARWCRQCKTFWIR
jgi:Flp pilus assembly protein TadB